MFILRLFVATVSVVFASATLAAPPIAGPDDRTSAVNVLRTMNVLINDSDPDGDAISVSPELAVQPSNGTVQIRADGGISYLPDAGFVGQDTFSYILVDANGESAIGVVRINVTDQYIAQATGNGVNTQNVARVLDNACNQKIASSNTDEVPRTARGELFQQACIALLSSDGQTLENAIASITPEETLALMRAASRGGQMQSRAVSSRISNLGRGGNTISVNGVTWNVGGGSGGAAGEGDIPPLGFFTSIMLESATKDMSDYETGYDSDGQGITIGADYALGNGLYVGGALGWNTSELDYQMAAGSMDSTMTNIFAYLLWQQEKLSVDAQLGYGFSDFDIDRSVSYTNIDSGDLDNYTAEGKTGGRQLTLSTQVQYLWNHKALNLAPFAKLNFTQNTINAYSEVNAGGFDVNLEKQKMGGVSLNFGVQGQYAINRDWGVLIPTFELNAISDISVEQDDVNGEFAFAESGAGTFTMSAEEQDSFYYRAGFGANVVLPNGFSGFANMQALLGYEDFESYQYQLGFRYEL